MIFGLVAVSAQEVVLAHVNIDVFRWEVECLIQVTVFYRVAATTFEVTAAAIFAGRGTHALGYTKEINFFDRESRSPFDIQARIIMAYQAIDSFLVGEIKVGIVPAIPGMTRRAARPVALNADAKIVDGVLFAYSDRPIAIFQVIGLAFPCPMGGGPHFIPGIFVAFQAGAGDFGPSFKGSLDDVAVIGVGDMHRNVSPGIIFRC